MSAEAREFQKRTVRHVARQLGTPGARFLVADEAGLGKTVIARDVLKELAHGVRRRFLVLYLCSNADIAKQNKARLLEGVPSASIPLASRLTLLPIDTHQERHSGLELIALTSGTSLALRGGRGSARERRFIHTLMILMKFRRSYSYSAARLMAPMARTEAKDWLRRVKDDDWLSHIEAWLDEPNVRALLEKQWRVLRPDFDSLLLQAKKRPDIFSWSSTDKKTAAQFVGKLREGLASVVIETLKPELIIMDEFQNFADILLKKDSADSLAQKLLKRDSRLLLLSATPYRAHTADFSLKDERHSEQFEAVVNFLHKDNGVVTRMKSSFAAHHSALQDGALNGSGVKHEAALKAKAEIEAILGQVMSRTERHDIDGAEQALVEDRGPEPWVESKDRPLGEPLDGLDPKPQDLRVRRWLMDIAADHFRHFAPVVANDIPFPLNFMSKDYRFIEELRRVRGVVPCQVAALDRQGFLLGEEPLAGVDFQSISANGKLRALLNMLEESQWGRHLWIPPSKAYYKTAAHADIKQLPRKLLVFTRWKALPHALSIIASQFAARKWGATHIENPYRLVYPSKRADPKVTHVSTLLLFHPSYALATIVDPLEAGMGELGLEEVLTQVRERLRRKLEAVGVSCDRDTRKAGEQSQVFDALWRLEPNEYRALYQETTRHRRNYLPETFEGDWPQGIVRYVRGVANERAGRFHGNARLQVSRAELSALAELAVGGPGVCVLRAMLRHGAFKSGMNSKETDEIALMGRILRVSHGSLRRFFNTPEVGATIRTEKGLPREAWAQVLRYCVNYHWQAVIDEFCGILAVDNSSLAGNDKAMALLKTLEGHFRVPLGHPQFRAYREDAEEKSVRTSRHIAQAFADEKTVSKERRLGSSDDLLRDHVRQAFNSPFWPFVLVTTSVGQEGLDFHRYCRDVVHWSLPSRAPAFEQREGRLQRYLSLAVRQTIADDFDSWREVVGGEGRVRGDPWQLLIGKAEGRLSRKDRLDGLSPYWIYRGKSSASTIRRWVLAHPFSKEAVEYRRLRESVVMYRLLLGASQQDDMMKALRRVIPEHIRKDEDALRRLLKKYWIDLRPPK